MTTFAVDTVKIEKPELPQRTSSREWCAAYLKKKVNNLGILSSEGSDFNAPAGTQVSFPDPGTNSFLQTALLSYNHHVPLTLSPDDVWIAVIQAVAQHIRRNPEDCRRALVDFEDKKELHVYADDFIRGGDNDWPRVFSQFGDQIEKYLGKKRYLFDPTFTTTGPVEKAAIQVQTMAALGSYFDYTMHTLCGIPHITLLGELHDWRGITERVLAFGEFYPSWALAPLYHVTSNFLVAASGYPDKNFWKNFVKFDGGSGGPYIGGFINAFFPYLNKRPNHMLYNKEAVPGLDPKTVRQSNKSFNETATNGDPWEGPTSDQFPGSITTTPMLWKYYDQNIRMTLASGIFGTTTYQGSFRPAIGWIVGENCPLPASGE